MFSAVYSNIQPYMKYENIWVYIWDPGLLGIVAWRARFFIVFVVTMLVNASTSLVVESSLPVLFVLFEPKLFFMYAMVEAIVEAFIAAIYFSPLPIAYLIASLSPEQLLLIWPSVRWALLGYASLSCVWSIYFLLFQVLALGSIVAGALFALKVRVKYLFSSFILVVSSFGLAALTGHANIGAPAGFSLASNAIFQYLVFGGMLGVLESFLTSPIFLISLICYLYVEIGLFFVYVSELTSPLYERSETVAKQLRAVDELASASNAMEMGGGVQLSKEALEFLEKLMKMKIFSSPEAAKLEVLHDARRLKTYMEEVFLKIPEARLTLSAGSVTIKATSLLKSSLKNVALRVCAVAVLSFVCLTSTFVLYQAGAPLIVLESIETSQPEIVLITLLPIALSFSMASTLIKLAARSGKKKESERKPAESGSSFRVVVPSSPSRTLSGV
ncbi:MAG: hypothetical protein QXK94_06325 [Candidatus Jordarchaeales archaeon]